MPRRIEQDPEVLRQRILDTAETIIRTQGVDGLNARALAKGAGYALGTTYTYFPKMSDVALAVLSRNLERLNMALMSRSDIVDGQQRLHVYTDVYLDFIVENAVSWRALFDYRRDHPETGTPDWYLGRIIDLTRIVAACFAQIAGTDVDPKRCADQALLLWSGIYGLTLLDEEKRFDTIIGGDIRQRAHALVDIHSAAWKASSQSH